MEPHEEPTQASTSHDTHEILTTILNPPDEDEGHSYFKIEAITMTIVIVMTAIIAVGALYIMITSGGIWIILISGIGFLSSLRMLWAMSWKLAWRRRALEAAEDEEMGFKDDDDGDRTQDEGRFYDGEYEMGRLGDE